MSTTTQTAAKAGIHLFPRRDSIKNPYVLLIQAFSTDPKANVTSRIDLRTDVLASALVAAETIFSAIGLTTEGTWSTEDADAAGFGERARIDLVEPAPATVEVSIPELIEEYVAVLVAAIDAYWKASNWQHAQPTVSIERGRVYSKIVKFDGTQHAVHSFVKNETGEVIKAAGWSSPAKDKGGLAVRFNLTDPASKAACFALVDPFGGYLYKR